MMYNTAQQIEEDLKQLENNKYYNVQVGKMGVIELNNTIRFQVMQWDKNNKRTCFFGYYKRFENSIYLMKLYNWTKILNDLNFWLIEKEK